MAVLASIEPADLQVEPGAEAWLVVRVRNRGSIVDRFDIAVVGPMAPWAFVDPPALRLFPDKEGEARIGFRPPRASTPMADTYPFGIAVRAASDPSDSTVEEGRITVAPFVELAAEVVPQTSRGSRSASHELTVQNRGNSVAEVSVRASDPDRLLTFDVRPQLMGLKPADSGSIRAVVKPKDTFLMGSPKRIPFFVHVDEPSAGMQQLAATIEQRPIIPGWVKPLAGLAVAAIAAFAFLPGVLGLNDDEQPTAAPTEAAVITEAPPTLEPPTEVPEPTEVPTPTPPFGPPDSLVAAGDEGSLTGVMGIDFVCPPGGTCRDAISDRLRGILGRLQQNVSGARLASFTLTPPGTLPLTAVWTTRPHAYSAADGTKGELDRVSIDLAPVLVGQPAYALVEDTSGLPFTFALSPEDSTALFADLYSVAIVTPTTAPGTGGTVFLDDIYFQPIGGLLLGDIVFFQTPPP